MLKVKSVKPLFTKLLVTAERYDDNASQGGIILKTAGSVKEYQKVLKVGSSVRDIKEGDIVMINPSKYIRKKFDDNSLREDFVENPVISVNIPIIEIEGIPYFYIDQSDVDYVIDDYEDIPESTKSSIIQPKPIKFDTPKIIV